METLCLQGIVERVVEAAGFVAFLRAADDQLGADGEVAQFQRIWRDEVGEVVFAYLLAKRLNAMTRAREALVRAHDAHVVPHEAPDLVPHVRNEHRLVWRDGASDAPHGNGHALHALLGMRG